ncbi:MAG: LptF/LptG family permease [Verrucomicrobiaceae bacterium]|nr:LptF/LptG family permease [Verrucomicrobiaceae bacterium]
MTGSKTFMQAVFQRLSTPLGLCTALALLAGLDGWWWSGMSSENGAAYWVATILLIGTVGCLIWCLLGFLRIFDRYIWGQVWSAAATGVMVLSGVMVLGNVYKKLDQLLGDAKLPVTFILEFVGLVVPFSLIFTIPWAFLTAILLVFGRLSADNEMVALRMTGTPMWRICLPVFVMAVGLSGVCFWVNVHMAPAAKNRMKRLFYDVATDNPITLFQPGRVLDKFDAYRIYTEKRTEDDELRNLQIIEVDGTRVKQFIRAKSATLHHQPGTLDFVLKLKDANIELVKEDGSGVDPVHLGETQITFPLSELKEKTERVNASMKSTSELWTEVSTGIDTYSKQPLDRENMSVSKTELSKRYSFSLACITFALVGIPLGITAQRRETTAGFVLSLMTATAYFVFIMVAETLNSNTSVFPHLLMWVPNIVFLALGGTLFYKLSHK